MLNLIIPAFLIGLIVGAIIAFLLAKRIGPAKKNNKIEFDEKKVENLLKKHGWEIINKKPKGSMAININGKEHFACFEPAFLVKKGKEECIVHIVEDQDFEVLDPKHRMKLIETVGFFPGKSLLAINPQTEEMQTIKLSFLKEKKLDGLFNFVLAFFIIFSVVIIVWLLAAIKLF